MNIISRAITAAALALVLLSGCGVGIIYTHTVEPLTHKTRPTTIVQDEKQGQVKHIQFSYLSVAWDSNAIGDIARKNGINTLYYADLETLSVLTIWRQYTVHVYGQ